MYNIPENLKYTKDHEWAKIEGDVAIIGVTDFAQSSLGDIVYIELPEKGSNLTKNSAFGVVESIKSVSDLYAPISGNVIDVNEELVGKPELCNQNAYLAWMIKVKLKSTSELTELLSAQQYKELIQQS